MELMKRLKEEKKERKNVSDKRESDNEQLMMMMLTRTLAGRQVCSQNKQQKEGEREEGRWR